MFIKLLASAGEGEIHTVSIPQEMWIENNNEAHWHIHEFINKAMRSAQQDAREEYEYWLWWHSGEHVGEEGEEDEEDEEGEEYMEIA